MNVKSQSELDIGGRETCNSFVVIQINFFGRNPEGGISQAKANEVNLCIIVPVPHRPDQAAPAVPPAGVSHLGHCAQLGVGQRDAHTAIVTHTLGLGHETGIDGKMALTCFLK